MALLELRARVEQLEADTKADQRETFPTLDRALRNFEKLEVSKRQASKVYEISKPLQLTPEQAQQINDLLAPEPRRNHPAKPDSSLVERVSCAIDGRINPDQWLHQDAARAAIREVALWLNEAPLDLYPGDRGIVVNTLYDQANQ